MYGEDQEPRHASDPTTLEIQNVRSELVNKALIFFAVLTPLALSVSLLRIHQYGWHPIYVLHSVLAGLVVAGAMFRRHLSYPIRASILVGFNLILGIAHVPVFGLAGGGMASLVVFAVLTALVYGTRAGLLACGLALAICAVTGFGVFTGANTFLYDVDTYAMSPITWAVQVTLFVMWVPAIVIAIGVVNEHLAASLRNARQSEGRLVAAQHLAGTGDFTWDVGTGVVTWSDALFDLLGYDKSERIDYRKVSRKVLHPEDVDRVTQWLNDCIASGRKELTPYEYRVVRKDGETLFVRTTGIIEHRPPESPRVFATVQDLTERKRSEDALHKSEERYRTIFQSGSVGFYIMTDVFLECNDNACRLWACECSEIVGHSPVEFSPAFQPDGRPSDVAARERIEAAQKGTPQRFYWQHRRKDGVLIDCEVTLDALKLGGESLLLASVTDITDRKQAEAKLQRLSAILEATSDMVSTSTSDHKVTYMNEAGRKMVGWAMDDSLEGRRISEVHPQWAFEVIRDQGIPFAIEHGTWRGETAILGPDGQEVPVSQVITAHRNASGKLEYMSTIMRDIRERKEAEIRLQQEKAFSDAVINALPGVFYVYEDAARLIRWNQNVETSTGFAADELLNKHPLAWFEEEDKENIVRAIAQAMQTGYATIAADIIIKDGSHVPYLLTGTRLERDGRQYLVGMGIDMTERKRDQEALMLTQFSVDHASDGAFWIDRNARFLYVNEAACNALGYSREELLNMAVYDIDPDYSRERWPGIWGELSQKKVLRFETYHRAKDGEVFPVEISANFVEFNGREYDFAFSHDISQRKAVEREREALLRMLAAKNEELESIIYASSHDLRSPLINIEGFAGELKLSADRLGAMVRAQPEKTPAVLEIEQVLDEEIPESVQFISAGVHKMRALLDGLLRLCRLGRVALKVQRMDAYSAFERIAEAMRYQIDQAGARVLIDPRLPACLADPDLFNQVFTNLLDNAIKYRDPGRPLVVHVSGHMEDGQAVYRVADNGRGIARQHQKRIFEVFHRLEPGDAVGGEGLGLTIVRRLLDRLGGTITLDSQPGEGSTFTVSLPAA